MGKQTGITMIEILVALFVLAVGLLGTASLQVRSVQDTGNSNLRSVATYLATSMSDRIRANRIAMEAGTYDSMLNAAINADCIGAAGCTATEMANHDKQQWLNNITQSLSTEATGTIARNGDLFTLLVTWPERVKQSGASIADGTVSLTFEP